VFYENALMSNYEYRKLYEAVEEIQYLRKQINLICKRMGIEYAVKKSQRVIDNTDPFNVYFGGQDEVFEELFGEDGLKVNSPKHTNVINYFDKKK